MKKHSLKRDYEAVLELPFGKQMQIDFVEKTLRTSSGGKQKIYFASFLLSRSRYGYVEMQTRPFTSIDLVCMCRHCFEYMGGMPQELVFDQDSIVCV